MHCSVGSCIAIILIILGVAYICDLILDDDSSNFIDIDESCPTSSQSQYGSPSPSCDSDPRSKVSCCSLNPVIKNQVQQMLDGPSCGRFFTDSCSLCLPNIGSKYLGAAVATTRDTKPYRHPMGSEASAKTNTPDHTIKPTPMVVGQNWHFVGVGTLVVKLFYPAYISGFSVLHPPKCEIPVGFESSTPKDFHVMGMNEIGDDEPFLFGNYTYNMDGPVAQTFPVQSCSEATYQFIEFRFTSNHGNPDYTALYKVRIHGDIPPPPRANITNNKDGSKTANESRSTK